MHHFTRTLPLNLALAALTIAISSAPPLRAATLTVTVSTDTVSGGPAGTGAGAAGDLRAQMRAAGPGDTINFACGSPCTVTLGGPLPPIASNLTIDGGTPGNVIIDGANLYRVFFVDTGTVVLANLQIQNGLAQGGNGGDGDGGGGGGAGLGGGLFINQSSATVTLTNDSFINCQALGGHGGNFLSANNAGGGGGGLAFPGGKSTGNTGGPGGGGVRGAGVDVAAGNNGTNGGDGGGGGGGPHDSASGAAGVGGTAYSSLTAGSNGSATGGGAGGFGGGGGGGAIGTGGAGGFGGGGGGTGANNAAGNGGPGGGGGGAGGSSTRGAGGPLVQGVTGGNAGTGTGIHGGGGGAAAGPAVFINAGSLTVTSSSATGSGATAGAGGTGQPAPALNGASGTADSTSTFNFAGLINGLANLGPCTVLDPAVLTLVSVPAATPSSPGPGQTVSLSATVSACSGVHTGTITFVDSGGGLGSGSINGSGVATLSVALSAGTHRITASYSGAGFAPSTSAALTLTIAPAMIAAPSLTLSITGSPNPSTLGQPVTFTASFAVGGTNSQPTGTVQFFDGSKALGAVSVSSGQAVFSTSTLSTGSHAILATYSGDSVFPGTSYSLGQVVNPLVSTTSLIATPMTALAGQPVVLTATVGPSTPPAGLSAPSGRVTFLDAGLAVGTSMLASGTATLSLTTLNEGAHTVTAVYGGDSTWYSSHAAIQVSVLRLTDAAANFSSSFAPDEDVSLFDVSGLSGDTAASVPLGTSLGGVTIKITDSAGVGRLAPLYGVFASNGQLNFVIPGDTAPGAATMTITLPGGAVVSAAITITETAPGIFTANSGGQGVYAGQVVHEHADGSQTIESSASLDPKTQAFVPTAIDFGPATDLVYLMLYGTGMRHAPDSITATVNGASVSFVFAAQGTYPGLDQINLQAPRSLAGAGAVNIAITAGGQAANMVTVDFQ